VNRDRTVRLPCRERNPVKPPPWRIREERGGWVFPRDASARQFCKGCEEYGPLPGLQREPKIRIIYRVFILLTCRPLQRLNVFYFKLNTASM